MPSIKAKGMNSGSCVISVLRCSIPINHRFSWLNLGALDLVFEGAHNGNKPVCEGDCTSRTFSCQEVSSCQNMVKRHDTRFFMFLVARVALEIIWGRLDSKAGQMSTCPYDGYHTHGQSSMCSISSYDTSAESVSICTFRSKICRRKRVTLLSRAHVCPQMSKGTGTASILSTHEDDVWRACLRSLGITCGYHDDNRMHKLSGPPTKELCCVTRFLLDVQAFAACFRQWMVLSHPLVRGPWGHFRRKDRRGSCDRILMRNCRRATEGTYPHNWLACENRVNLWSIRPDHLARSLLLFGGPCWVDVMFYSVYFYTSVSSQTDRCFVWTRSQSSRNAGSIIALGLITHAKMTAKKR